jgi:hypothetical protein
MYAKVVHGNVHVHKEDGREEHEGERQKRDSQKRIPHASRIPEPFRDTPIGAFLVRFDGHLEDRLGQHVEQPAAEQPEGDS